MPITVENNSVLAERKVPNVKSTKLLHSNSNLSDKKHLDNQRDFSPSFEIHVDRNSSECGISFSVRKDNDKEPIVSDFQSFSFLLQQDYTKSGKGYSLQSKDDKIEFENVANLCNNDSIKNIEESVDNSEFNVSDDEYYDPAQDLIISKYLNSLKSSSSESEMSNNEICFDSDSDDSIVFSENIGSMQKNTGYNKCRTNICKKIEPDASCSFDSDSDDSVVFSENIGSMQKKTNSNKCGTNTRKEIELDVSFCFDSDSDDNVEIFELFDSKCLKKSSKGCLKSIYDVENDVDSEMSNSVLFQSYEKNLSCSLYQNFDSSVRTNEEFSNISFSLSQSKLHVYSTDFEGFVNPCFEDDSPPSRVNLRSINDKWENSMQDISCEPRQPKRVSFVPVPDLVSIQTFEPDEDNYRYGLFVLDQLRFKNRIEEFEEIIKPYLSPHHRAKVYECYYSSNDQLLV